MHLFYKMKRKMIETRNWYVILIFQQVVILSNIEKGIVNESNQADVTTK